MAREFTDESGQVWRLSITVASLRKVREQVGFDCAKLLSEEAITQLQDPVLLVDVLACLLEAQINAREMSAVKFAESLCGDAIERGLMALVEAVADFLPSTQRAILLALWGKGKAIQETTKALIMERIESMPTSFGEWSPSLKAEPVSTPAAEPLQN